VYGKRLRTQTDADGRYIIFKEDALYAVDPAKKAYMVVDRGTGAALGAHSDLAHPASVQTR